MKNPVLLWTSRAVLIVTLPYSVTYENRPYHIPDGGGCAIHSLADRKRQGNAVIILSHFCRTYPAHPAHHLGYIDHAYAILIYDLHVRLVMIGQAGLEPFFASHAHPYPNHYLNIVGAT
jgi:hypothetical protein